jgi:hypothetical protein
VFVTRYSWYRYVTVLRSLLHWTLERNGRDEFFKVSVFDGGGELEGGAGRLARRWRLHLQAQIAQEPALTTQAISQDPYCTVTGEALKYMSPSTRKMAALLEKIARTSNPRANQFLNHQRAELYRAQIGGAKNRTVEAGLSGLVGGLNIIQGDYNNDGLPDVLVLRGAWLMEAGHHRILYCATMGTAILPTCDGQILPR